MSASSLYTLTNKQKWRLGFGLAIIYVPIRIYINVSVVDQQIFFNKLPLWLMELLISAIFYTLWIIVIERLQQYISGFLGEKFLDEFRFFNQLFALLIAIALAILFNTVFRILWHWMEAIWEQRSINSIESILNQPQMKRKANNGITVLALMAAYYLAANKRIYQKLQQVHINEERLEKENVKAHFNALKNQISPHFLFNNFSVLTTLVETDQQQSIVFINRLSKAYRYILEQSDFDYISLRKEIDFLETYMFLLTTRFQDKLFLDVKISEAEMKQYSIVPLTLQLLVENAVKHNQMSTGYPLTIRIFIDGEYIVVSNPLKLRDLPEPSTKLGLDNIINRYKLLLDKQVLIDQSEAEFTVKIPLINESADY